MSHAVRRALFAVALGVWALLVGAALKSIFDYKTAAGAQGFAPPAWPLESSLVRHPDRFTLVMFLHPQCPCSRASLSELSAIMNEERADTDVVVVFLRPSGVPSDWERTDLWTSAGRVPRTVRVVDPDGLEAKRFGALTSGHVVLYDSRGQLRFSGGITESRGHEGDNMGRKAMLALLADAPTNEHGHPVYGCSMDDPAGAGGRAP